MLRWISQLYGRSDPKYANLDYLQHQFRGAPDGPAVHAFAMRGDSPVGHCAVVPMAARSSRQGFLSGKVEAFYIDEASRAETIGGRSLAQAMLSALYARAHERRMSPLHAAASPQLGVLHRMVGCTSLHVAACDRILLLRPRLAQDAGLAARLLARPVSACQWATTLPARALPFRRWHLERDPGVISSQYRPAPLADLGGSRWTIDVGRLWPWFAASGRLAAVECAGGPWAIVRLPEAEGAVMEIVSCSTEPLGHLRAFRLLSALLTVARRTRAGALINRVLSGIPTTPLVRAMTVVGGRPRN